MGKRLGSNSIGMLTTDLTTAGRSSSSPRRIPDQPSVSGNGSQRRQALRPRQEMRAEGGNRVRLLDLSLFEPEIAAFLTDRRSRGLSERTVSFYRDELRYLTTYLKTRGVQDVASFGADHLRTYLVQLAEHRNAGGVHAAYRAIRAFLRWCEEETEPEG